MPNLRPVLLVTGALVAALGVAMLLPMLADLLASDPAHRRDWTAFATGAIVAIFAGGGAAAASWGRIDTLSVREGFLITAGSWLALVVFAAVPLTLGEMRLSYADAFFEAMSGITTTGSTVVVGLDEAPPGFLLWRSMLQWFGGVGVIIMAFAVLPALKIGGMQLFRIEAWDISEKFMGNAAQYSLALSLIYAFLTALCFLILWACGLTPFDAVNHAMTTLATGGFSTKDASVGAFLAESSAPVDLVITAFMIVGSLPFGIYLIAILRGAWGRLFTDSQIRFFLSLIAATTLVISLYIYARFDVSEGMAIRVAVFNIVSVMTGTGFTTADYSSWGAFAVGFFFCIMFIGGCAGSTSCGLKIFRLQVALSALSVYGRRLAHPNGVFVAHYNARPLTDDVFVSVLSFFFVYFASFATLAVLLTGVGLDPIAALSSAATATANVGPGLGPEVGPAGNFANLPDAGKWLMAAGMLLGRLEFFTILVLFAPGFWRR